MRLASLDYGLFIVSSRLILLLSHATAPTSHFVTLPAPNLLALLVI